jgi:hypothetical protein
MVARRQVPQRCTVFAVPEDVLDLGTVAVPVLDDCRLVRTGQIEVVRMNE